MHIRWVRTLVSDRALKTKANNVLLEQIFTLSGARILRVENQLSQFKAFELRNVRSSKGIPCSPNVRIDHCFQSNLYQPPPSTVKASSETLDILLQPSIVYIDDKHILVFIDKVKRVDVKKKKNSCFARKWQ